MANRRQFISQLTMATSAATFLRPLQVFAKVGNQPTADGNTITILHTTCLQGQWQALPTRSKLHGLGGMQQLLQKLTEIKNKSPFSLLIHSGNITTDRVSDQEHQRYCEAMRQAKYDAIVPEETELLNNKNEFAQTLTGSGLPFLSSENYANYSAYLPYTIIRKAGFHIGVIDATSSSKKTLRLQAAAINKTAAMLKNSRCCPLVLCVAPSSANGYQRLAGLTSGVDVLLCTSGKTTLCNTEIVQSQSGQEVILSYAGKQGTMISRIDLTFSDQREKTGFVSRAVFVGAREEGYAALIKQYNLALS